MPQVALIHNAEREHTLELTDFEKEVVRDGLFDQLQWCTDALGEHFQDYPTQNDMKDARWKLDRIAVAMGLLEQIGFIPREGD